ncbi:hypothetical protein IWQ47_004925 [Aquimarina sp. EL_43]|uniref:hypothetical protein n=1 Tax=Aquimarina TaxID=290174 RepID=UPI0004700E53|nr:MULTISPECIES: hypothetical protein [Aquimarina]MBG6133513.1 hypothetical protein [Aquimarina sp. EL_35]MBG6153694.1 hypothetical protein [Aquimarina sp. EL_32]MBG6171827.1 hypothetical protein [Aquimarina sp. EL_43]
MENEDKSPRKTWDLMIGIALVLFGGLRLYNRLQAQAEWDFRVMITILFIGYGGYLIYKHFQTPSKD